MQSIAVYLLKVMACSGLLLLNYRLTLHNKRFHYYNRFYLLITVVASILLPLLNINWITIHSSSSKAVALLNVIYVQDDNVNVTGKGTGFVVSWQQAALLCYVAVAAGLLGTLCYRVRKIYLYKRRYPTTNMGKVEFINTDLSQAPFSFLQNLFWRDDIDLNETAGRQILRHELTHISQKHTWDKLFMQIILSVCWINPFYWFIQRELYLLHEFIADEKAIENNDGAAFAAMLLASQYGKNIFSPAQPFAYSPIKRRLLMLTNIAKPKYSYARRIMVLPLLAFIVLLSAFKIQKNTAGNTGNGTTAETYNSAAANNGNAYPEDTTINKKDTADVILQEPAHNTNKEHAASTLQIKEVTVVGRKDTSKALSKVLVIVDGKEIPFSEMQTLNPNDIESIAVLKNETAVDKYGAKGANGVLEIITKNGSTLSSGEVKEVRIEPQEITVQGYPTKKDASVNLTLTEIKAADGSPLTLKNGNITMIADSITVSQPKLVVLNPRGTLHTSAKMAEIQPASFPGGHQAWEAYLTRNLKSGIVTDNGGPVGTYVATVSFMVDENGNLSNFKIEKDPGYGTGAEALRVLQRGPRWVPGKQEGKAVKVMQKQSITWVVSQ